MSTLSDATRFFYVCGCRSRRSFNGGLQVHGDIGSFNLINQTQCLDGALGNADPEARQ